MPLRLPTDTQHIRLRTRQYELFGRSLGQGVERRTLLVVVLAVAVWWLLLFTLGVPLLSRYSPLLYLVPPIAMMINGTRQDSTGRMALVSWLDWALSRLPHRSGLILNPLLPHLGEPPAPLHIEVTTQVTPTQDREVP